MVDEKQEQCCGCTCGSKMHREYDVVLTYQPTLEDRKNIRKLLKCSIQDAMKFSSGDVIFNGPKYAAEIMLEGSELKCAEIVLEKFDERIHFS